MSTSGTPYTIIMTQSFLPVLSSLSLLHDLHNVKHVMYTTIRVYYVHITITCRGGKLITVLLTCDSSINNANEIKIVN